RPGCLKDWTLREFSKCLLGVWFKLTHVVFPGRMKLRIDIKEYDRNSAALFIDLTLTSVGLLPSLAEETDGHPEHASLYMPSHLMDCPPRAKDKGKPSKNTARVPNTETKLPPVQLDLTERSTRVVQLEVEVRRAECYETLQRIRMACIQKAQMVTGKNKHARGEKANTRAQTMITRLTTRVTQAMNDYNHSFRALRNLGVSSTDIKPFQLMHSTDMKGLNTILKGERTLGEKDRKLPWFWRVKHHDGGDGDEEDEEEFVEAICVEWFRGHERFRRWREEVLWLRRELASTLFDYHHRWEHLGWFSPV
ncbi:hypothetical protein RSAG8_13900, partial [Rhizoctonia solani AG-8 WAC10335]